MQRERGGVGERLELKLVDGRTGKVKRHLVVDGGGCVDLAAPNLAFEIKKTKELLSNLALKELLGESK